jgi:hypothetical protein
MKFSKYFFVGLVTVTVACSSPSYLVTHSASYKIPLDSTLDKIADKSYLAYLKPITGKNECANECV